MLQVTQKYTRKKHASQRGIAIVEFTILLPLILFMMLAVAEFGRAFLQYNTLTRAVRDGARYASGTAFQGSTQVVQVDAALTGETRNLVVYGIAAGGSNAVLPNFSTGDVTLVDAGAGNISVTASYDYQPMIGAALPRILTGSALPTVFTFRAQVTMKAIG
jgi:Flp pilus assembly protein TadG